jgi:hypothetical protein
MKIHSLRLDPSPNVALSRLSTGYVMPESKPAPYWYHGGYFINGAGSTVLSATDLLQFVETYYWLIQMYMIQYIRMLQSMMMIYSSNNKNNSNCKKHCNCCSRLWKRVLVVVAVLPLLGFMDTTTNRTKDRTWTLFSFIIPAVRPALQCLRGFNPRVKRELWGCPIVATRGTLWPWVPPWRPTCFKTS